MYDMSGQWVFLRDSVVVFHGYMKPLKGCALAVAESTTGNKEEHFSLFSF